MNKHKKNKQKPASRATKTNPSHCSCGCCHGARGQQFTIFHSIPIDPEEHQARFPEHYTTPSPSTFGPTGLLDVARQRTLHEPGTNRLLPESQKLRPGDFVHLEFNVDPYRVSDLPPWLSHLADAVTEVMCVRITAIEGDWPHATYRGELWDLPVVINRTVLRGGSPVTFRAEHIYSVGLDEDGDGDLCC
jgi:hypothetical protein